VEVQLNMGWSY